MPSPEAASFATTSASDAADADGVPPFWADGGAGDSSSSFFSSLRSISGWHGGSSSPAAACSCATTKAAICLRDHAVSSVVASSHDTSDESRPNHLTR